MPSPPSGPDAPPPEAEPLIPAGGLQPGLSLEQAMRQAHGHWNAGHVDKAEQLCQQVLRAWPGYADALHLLGVMAVTWGNLDAAVGYLRQACLAPRAPALYHSNLAEMLRRKGLRAEALEAARRSVTLEPSLAQAWNNLGIILLEEGALAESALALDRALGLNRDFVEAYTNLGNVRRAQGRLPEARDLYQQALQRRPDNAEAACNLSAVLGALGDCDGALAQAKRAIELQPQRTEAYLNAAAAETSRGRFEAALPWLEALAAFAPHHREGLVQRARVLVALDRLEDAAAVVERALILTPDDAAVLTARAAVLAGLGRHDEALAAYEAVETAQGRPPEGKAVLLLQLGRIAEAEALFQTLLAADPAQPLLWHRRVEAKVYQAGDPDIAAMERLLTTCQGADDRLALSFALGKAYLDIGDGSAAFRHLHAGNAQRRAGIVYDPASADRWMGSIAGHYGAETIARLAGQGDPDDAPVFLLGLPRSGIALVEHMLAAHPAVHGGGALTLTQQLSRKVFNRQGQAQPYPGFARSLGPEQTAALGRQYMRQARMLAGRAGAGDAGRLIDAMPMNFLFAGLIHLMLPNARFIHVRRDPRDTGLSLYSRLLPGEVPFAYDLAEIGRFARTSDRLFGHWQSVLPAAQWLEVTYEQVVAAPEAETRRMIEFCGLPWDDRCLTFWETNRLVQTASLWQVRQPVYATGVGRWKPFATDLQPLLTALALPADEETEPPRPD